MLLLVLRRLLLRRLETSGWNFLKLVMGALLQGPSLLLLVLGVLVLRLLLVTRGWSFLMLVLRVVRLGPSWLLLVLRMLLLASVMVMGAVVMAVEVPMMS